MDWIGIAAAISAVAGVIAAIGVIVNNVMTHLARRDVAENTEETKATGRKVIDAATSAKDAAEVTERGAGVTENAMLNVGVRLSTIEKQLNGALNDKLKKVEEHDGEIREIKLRLGKVETNTNEILSIVKRKDSV